MVHGLPPKPWKTPKLAAQVFDFAAISLQVTALPHNPIVVRSLE
jgi:hypothetical protein